MRFKTLRNLMASMLVLGVAGSVIGVGSGTFAQFNAVTTNTGNTFASSDIKFVNTNGAGTACTGQSSVTNGVASGCGVIATLGSLIPGDSKLGLFTLVNNSSTEPALSIKLAVAAELNHSSLLDTNTPTSGTSGSTGGLALLVFRCTAAGGTTAQACTGVANTNLVPVIGTCTGTPSITATTGLTKAAIGGASTSAATVTVGDAFTVCTGGPIITSSTSIGGLDTVNGVANVLGVGHTDNLGALVYLPGTSGNAMAALSDIVDFTWTATQIPGTAQ